MPEVEIWHLEEALKALTFLLMVWVQAYLLAQVQAFSIQVKVQVQAFFIQAQL